MNREMRVSAILSLNRALLGEIYPQTRAVLIRPDDPLGFSIEFYVDGPVSEELLESASCVETEVLADFDPEVVITHRVMQWDGPLPLPTQHTIVVFRRNEKDSRAEVE